ncbi:MAG: UbiA-like polyprenyltransferase [Chthonomonadales bacterium]
MAVYPGGLGTGERPPMLVAGWRSFCTILEMIKVEHTVFAMPFAIIGALLAARSLPHGVPPGRVTWWIVVAMVAARSAAMAFNRLADAELDAANPRTAQRAIPAGLLTTTQVGLFTIASIALFEYAAYRLNPLCFTLSPVALVIILGYSYTKRYTALSHVILGLADGISPVGAWLAVTGRFDVPPLLLAGVVTLWIGGFDIIYALQDLEFDRKAGLHSIPKQLGPEAALRLSRMMHGVMLLLLVAVGQLCGLHQPYYLGVMVVGALIAYEHSLVQPNDLSRINLAFFVMNGWVSIALLAFVVLDRILAH